MPITPSQYSEGDNYQLYDHLLLHLHLSGRARKSTAHICYTTIRKDTPVRGQNSRQNQASYKFHMKEV